jgi:hypothetical protein
MKVLALSHTYEPLGVINWEKAITLLCSGKVLTLSEYEREVRSPTCTMRIPSVVVSHQIRHGGLESMVRIGAIRKDLVHQLQKYLITL